MTHTILNKRSFATVIRHFYIRICYSIYKEFGDRGGTVVKLLCYTSEGRWFDPSWCHWNFGVNSASNRNEYQEHFLGVKAAGA